MNSEETVETDNSGLFAYSRYFSDTNSYSSSRIIEHRCNETTHNICDADNIVINKLLVMNVATFTVYNISSFNTNTIMVWFINSYITIYCNAMKYSTGEKVKIRASPNEINFNQSKKMKSVLYFITFQYIVIYELINHVIWMLEH